MNIKQFHRKCTIESVQRPHRKYQRSKEGQWETHLQTSPFRFHPNTKTSPYSYIVFKPQLLRRYRTTTTSCFFTKRMLSTVTQISIAYQIVGIESVGFKFTNRIGPGSNFFHYTQQQVDLWWTSIFIHTENWLVVNVRICQNCNLWKYILKHMISAELLQSGFISERISSRMWKWGMPLG